MLRLLWLMCATAQARQPQPRQPYNYHNSNCSHNYKEGKQLHWLQQLKQRRRLPTAPNLTVASLNGHIAAVGEGVLLLLSSLSWFLFVAFACCCWWLCRCCWCCCSLTRPCCLFCLTKQDVLATSTKSNSKRKQQQEMAKNKQRR